MKPKEIIIDGKTLTIAEAKRRREQLARGFATGMFDKTRHAKAYAEYMKIGELLNK